MPALGLRGSKRRKILFDKFKTIELEANTVFER
jgi:hypothetical protein